MRYKVIKMSQLMINPTKWHVRPAKTQISLGICPVWSESSPSAWRKLGSLATHWAQSKDSDQTGRMPRLIWVFAGRTCHFVGFVVRWLISIYDRCHYVSVRSIVRRYRHLTRSSICPDRFYILKSGMFVFATLCTGQIVSSYCTNKTLSRPRHAKRCLWAYADCQGFDQPAQ